MGLDNAGKTTMIKTFFKIEGRCPPTFGYSIYTVKYPSLPHINNCNNVIGNSFTLNILDIGGQSCFKNHWSNYFEKTDGIIFVVDSTDRRDFTEYLNELVGLNVPMCLFINKVDLNSENKMDENRMNENRMNENRMKMFKTTVKDLESINKGFEWLTQQITNT